jgi:hypothetical protein
MDGAGNFWALVFGLMATIFGGYAFCYGLVILSEKIVHLLHAKRVVVPSVPPVGHAA